MSKHEAIIFIHNIQRMIERARCERRSMAVIERLKNFLSNLEERTDDLIE